MDQRIQPLPPDRVVPQAQRVQSRQRDGGGSGGSFDVGDDAGGHLGGEPKDEKPHADEEHAPPPAAHEDGTGSRLDVTA